MELWNTCDYYCNALRNDEFDPFGRNVRRVFEVNGIEVYM